MRGRARARETDTQTDMSTLYLWLINPNYKNLIPYTESKIFRNVSNEAPSKRRVCVYKQWKVCMSSMSMV